MYARKLKLPFNYIHLNKNSLYITVSITFSLILYVRSNGTNSLQSTTQYGYWLYAANVYFLLVVVIS